MLKRVLISTVKRMLTMFVSAALILQLMPITPAYASIVDGGSLTVDGLTATSADGNGTWQLDGTSVVGAVSGSGGCNPTQKKTSLELVNDLNASARIVFNYKAVVANGGAVTVDGNEVGTSGSFNKELSSKESITVSITSGSGANETTNIEITGLSLLVNQEISTTFLVSSHGTYTVDGESISADDIKTKNATTPYELIASAEDGYSFFGWEDKTTESIISYDSAYSYYASSPATIQPIFIEDHLGVFQVGTKRFYDLNKAVSYSVSSGIAQIVLIESGTLNAGSYTIPAGKTLLVPFNSSYSCYTTEPEMSTTRDNVSPFKVLTLESGASIVVNGSISVSAQQYVQQGGQSQACVAGPYGQIQLNDNSSVVVKRGGSLYAWGYITGSGVIAAENGAKVYEMFQVQDWRGGSATGALGNDSEHKVFPFSQYYVQNIETPITFEYGSSEYVVFATRVSIFGNVNATVPFIDDEGLFKLKSGSTATKRYDSQTDRLIVDINGDAEVSSMALSISGASFDSSNSILGINGNITINVHSGTCTTSQDLALLPGSMVKVDNGAVLKIASGRSVYVYDGDEWNGKGFVFNGQSMKPVIYSPTRKTTRPTSLPDACVDLNGSAVVNGAVYTTASGAAIVSTQGIGKVIFEESGAASDGIVYQTSNNGSSFTEIAVESAKLKNGDGTYAETAGSPVGTTFYYCTTCAPDGVWEKEHSAAPVNVTFDANAPVGTTATGSMDAQQIASGVATALSENKFDIEHYHFTGWNTNADGTGTAYTDKQEVTLTEDITLYAQWEKDAYTVTWKDADGTVLETDENVDYGATPSYDGETPTKQADAQYTYTFSGWTPEVTTVSGDTTYTATYSQTVNEYTVKFVNDDGTELQNTKVAYGETPAYTGETPTKASTSEFTYSFKGWTPEITSVTGDATYKATYTEAKNSYTITWKNDDGSVIDTTTVEYGTVPTHDDATKTADAQYTYTFAAWSPEPAAVTGDAKYTATFNKEINKYTIKFVNDGTELQSSEVAYGETPAYTGEVPTKAGDVQYNYVFYGWDPTIGPVDGEATYTAQYTPTKRSYTVTWTNYDGSTLETDENVEYGTNPSYDGETPTKPGDTQYTYTFAGWTPEVAEVAGNVTYTATFTPTVNKYTIKFVDEDDTELQSSEVAYGETPVYEGEMPTKPANDEFTYTFAGWDKTLVAVTGEATYKATYTQTTNEYEVKFVDEDGTTELQKETLGYGAAIKYNEEEPTKTADAQYTYAFAGWKDAATGEVVDFDDEQHPVTVTGPTTFVAYYKATVNEYNITFKNEDGTALQSSRVAYGETPVYEGETPTKDATNEFSYEFAGWSPAISEVTGDATYTAKFNEVKQAYTIVFVNANGEELQTSKVGYGETPAYTGETPTRAADAQYTYTFTGWTPEIASVTGNATYTATFSETVNEYTITFKNEDGTELQSSKVPYGQVPAYTGEIPAKADDEQYTYTFERWSDGAAMLSSLPKVTGDATYTAVFTSELKSYQITFDANGGEGIMDPQALGYGVEGTLNENSFAKQGSAFNGWNTKADGSGTTYEDKDSITITSDVTLYAQWVLDGWQTAENGDLTYYVKGELQKSGWTEIEGKIYHLDSETGVAAAGGIYWLERPEGYAASQWDIDNNDDYETLGYLENSYFVFGDDGEFQSATSGMYSVAANTKVIGGNANSPDDVLVVWADRGEIPWHAGLVTWQGYHYYFSTGAFEAGKSFVANTNYYVSKPNEVAWPEEWGAGTFERGKYTFDASGHMLLRDGFVDVGEDTLYYAKGALVYAGLIDVDGDYYYVKSDSKLVKGRDYYVSKTNDLVAAGTYTFDADGKMVRPEDLQQGLIWKDGELYYYVDGEPSYAGLVEVDGYYYYFPGSKVAVRGQDYTITKTNGLKPQARYTFDSEGKMVVLDGIVKDGDTWTYYIDGAKTYAGLIEIDGAYYYVKSDGTVIHGQDYTITKTNGLKAAGKYAFDADGKMVVLDGIARDGDTWTYYVDGAKVYAGLIEIDGAYYYVKSDCTVVHGRDYYVSKNNGIVSSGTYAFDAEGKMQQ